LDPTANGSTTPETMIVKEADDTIRPLAEMVAGYITKALTYTNGKVEGKDGAAQLLGLHPSTLRGMMKKLIIPYGRKVK
jgi:hypothetical protein